MGRFWQRRLAACAGLGWLLVAGPVEAQVPVKRIQIGGSARQKIQVIATPQRAVALIPAIPGYHLLRLEHVQKELELLDEQKEKLEQIAKRYYDQTRQNWSDFRELSLQERQRKMAEIRQKNEERLEAVRKQTEEVLLPHQLARLKKIEFRIRATAALANPRILDQLGLSDQQKQWLEEIRAEMEDKTRQLQEEMLEKSLQLLTPEQRDNLRQINTPGFKLN